MLNGCIGLLAVAWLLGHQKAVWCWSQEEWQQSREFQQLQSNLGQERKAVHTFLFTVCDEVGCDPCALTPLLEPPTTFAIAAAASMQVMFLEYICGVPASSLRWVQ